MSHVPVTQLCSYFVFRLGSHLSPSKTECYITSDMFYVEVQLDTMDPVIDVKVAHHGENPAVRHTGRWKKEQERKKE